MADGFVCALGGLDVGVFNGLSGILLIKRSFAYLKGARLRNLASGGNSDWEDQDLVYCENIGC